MSKTISLLLFVSAVFFITSCAGPTANVQKNVGPDYANLPGWVSKGAGFFNGDRGKAFYGVGLSKVGDPVVRRQDSELQARAELAKTFQSKVSSLMKSYRKVIIQGEKEANEALLQQTSKLLSTAELKDSAIVDHHFDNKTGIEYTLAVLDLDAYKSTISQIEALPEEFKNKVQESAEAAFKELEKLESGGSK